MEYFYLFGNLAAFVVSTLYLSKLIKTLEFKTVDSDRNHRTADNLKLQQLNRVPAVISHVTSYKPRGKIRTNCIISSHIF